MADENKLPSMTSKIEDIPEQLRQYYTKSEEQGSQGEDVFMLNISSNEALNKVKQFRQTNIDLKKKVETLETQQKTLQEQFEPFKQAGVNQEKLAQLLKTEEEFAKMKSSGQEEQQQQQAQQQNQANLDDLVEERVKPRIENLKKEYDTKHEGLQKKLDKIEEQRNAYKTRVYSQMVNSHLNDALEKAGLPVVQGGMSDVLNRARGKWRVEEQEDGSERIVAYNEQGHVEFGHEQKEPLTMTEWVQDLKKDCPHLFVPNTGTGATGTQTARMNMQGTKVVGSGDMGEHLQDIAEGKVSVVSQQR